MIKANPQLVQQVQEILQDQDTKEWLETIDSESAQISYQKHVAEYLLYRQIQIKQLIQNFKENEIDETKKLQAFVNQMLTKLTASTVANYVSAIKSRLKYDGIRPTRDVKVKNRHRHPTVANEVVPTKDQIISFLTTANPGTQVIIVLSAFLGFRFKVMSDLRVSDFPEMRITENGVVFEKVPTRVRVRAELSKNKKEYQTFLLEFGCKILQNWLQIRMKKGEKLDSDSLIVKTECDSVSLKKRSNAISRRLYTVFEKVGYESRPYSLKNFFATALLNSGIQQNYQTFFMGHTGPVQNEYSVRRQQPSEQIEIMRTMFKEKIEPYLVPHTNNADALINEKFKLLAGAFGMEIKENSTTNETIEEIAKLYASAKDDLNARIVPKIAHSTKKQKRVTEDVLDNYLEEGWEVVSTLQSGSIVIQKPF